MTEEHSNSVQLQDEELQSMRKLVSTAEDSLRQIAMLTRAKLQRDTSAALPHGRPKGARFYFDNLTDRIRVVIDDESGCSVYEYPPGWCRPCNPGE